MMICATPDPQFAWNTVTPLFHYQQTAVDKLKTIRVGALFMEMGTGKTRTAIELAWLRQNHIDRVIWFCPVSLKATIRREILKHTDCPPESVYLFDGRTCSDRLPGAFWYIVGIESMSASPRAIFSVNELVTKDTMVICDESSYIKGHRAKRTERIIELSKPARYRLILTGTPISQGIQDLYTQMRFLSPKILGYRSWYTFQRNHLEYSERYKGLIVAHHNTEWLAAKIQPYVYQVTKDECMDLPKKIYLERWTELTTEQMEAYDKAKERFVEEMLDYAVDNDTPFQASIPIFRLFTNLQRIVCGWDRFRPEGQRQIPHHRLQVLRSIIGGIDRNEPVVIWVKYQNNVREVVAALREDHGAEQVVQLHGEINVQRRNAELDRWRERGRFLVVTQSVGGFGLDFSMAKTVIFYANGFKYSERLQAEDRCHRLGQNGSVRYVDIWSDSGIEKRIWKALAKKGHAVEEFKREVDRVKNAKELIELVRGL